MTPDQFSAIRARLDGGYELSRLDTALLLDEVERLTTLLAERQDSATDVVEWQMTNNPIGTMHAYLDGVDLRVRWDGQDAAWDATRYGRCATEAEARRAATAAARGMR
jgi:hypothetical protein